MHNADRCMLTLRSTLHPISLSSFGAGNHVPNDGHEPYSNAPTPALSRSNSTGSSSSFPDGIDLTAGEASWPLADVLETFLDSRMDLMDRKWREFSGDIKLRARQRREALVKRAKSKSEIKAMEKELVKMRRKVSERVERLSTRWQDAKVVRLRDKVSFVVGVMNLVASSLIFALKPEWVPSLYTLQTLWFLPLRIYSYRKLQWHYFLFDYCYFLNVTNLLYIWVWPDSRFLFTVCYCAAHGPLAFSVATWRNSMVFHSLDKITSLFIHLYPPFVFTTIRHFYPREAALERFKALQNMPFLNHWTAFWFNIAIYCIWQFFYFQFVVVRKKVKIEAGHRPTSYTTMSRNKGAIGKTIAKFPPAMREPGFMLLQFLYTILTTLPASLIFYDSSKASATFLLAITTLSVWNGASYYVEVWGRRFEKELLELRREMEQSQATEAAVKSALDDDSVPSSSAPSRRASQAGPVTGSGAENEPEGGTELVEEKKDR